MAPPIKMTILFFLINIAIIIYQLRSFLARKYRIRFEYLKLQENFNILKNAHLKELQNKVSLQEKMRRYDSLKKIMEEISQDLELESIADNLAAISFSLIANFQGTCILYLVDSLTQKPLLFKTKKEDEKMIIKAKEGDIFDFWVLRHGQPLLVEDIRRDFRFDMEKLQSQEVRTVSSLISAPFISDNRLLGLLRLDSPQTHTYSQDDLRFLMTICELGALALEDAQLYQKTREMAIRDGLTALFTKGYFLERLKEEYKRSLRQRTALSLLMLDVDYFKSYNDKFGHTAGDLVLKNLGLIMNDFLGDLAPIIISRFGGEEFSILLPQIDKAGAFQIAESLRLRVEKAKVILRNQETNITLSIGVANFPSDAGDEDELVLKADKALYLAKQRGRNRVCGI